MELPPTDGQSNLPALRRHTAGDSLNTTGVDANLSAEGSFLLEYVTILKKRKWVILACVAIIGALFLISAVRQPRLYVATGRIAINRDTPMDLGLKDFDPAFDDYDLQTVMETQVRILQSDSLAFDVIKTLKLDNNPQFAPVPPAQKGELGANIDADSPRESALLGTLHGGLNVAVLPGTRIIEIRYTSTQPKLCASIVNQLMNSYIEENFKTKFDSTMQASEWLSQQLGDLRIKMETADEKLVQYQKDNNIIGVDDKQNIVTAKLDELNRELTQAEADRIQKEALYRLASSGNSDLLGNAVRGAASYESALERLRNQEHELRVQYAQATTQFGPSYPKVVELQNQLNEIQRQINVEVQRVGLKLRTDYLAAAQRETLLNNAVEKQKAEAAKISQAAIQYNLLKRDADSYRQLYEGLLQKVKEAGVSAGLKSSNVRVVDTARVPLQPFSPNIRRSVAIGILIGLIAGIALAFILESLDNTIRTTEQAEAISGLPSLAAIPLNERLTPSMSTQRRLSLTKRVRNQMPGISTIAKPLSEAAESYRALRTSILLSSVAKPKLIMITSPLPQEGKTTTAVNTGVVLADGSNRVLLVDGDLRRPTLHRQFALSNDVGLTTLLTGQSSMAAVIRATEIPGLSVVTAGPATPNPTELLGSETMQKYLALWRTQFDHVVVDTPPILSVTDAVLLSVHADSVLLVIRAARTSKAALRRARDILAQVNARVLGVVVNALDVKATDYKYYYYYKSDPQKYYREEEQAAKGEPANKDA